MRSAVDAIVNISALSITSSAPPSQTGEVQRRNELFNGRTNLSMESKEKLLVSYDANNQVSFLANNHTTAEPQRQHHSANF